MKSFVVTIGAIVILSMSLLASPVYAAQSARSLRYSYSGAASLRTGPTSHTSAVHSFGKNFDVYYSINCLNYDTTDYIDPTASLIFSSHTLHRTWESRTVNNGSTTHSLNVSGHWHSNVAQKLTMRFNATMCSYNVRVYQ